MQGFVARSADVFLERRGKGFPALVGLEEIGLSGGS